MPSHLSASSLYRAKRCPTSMVLPHVRTTSEYAERGTEVDVFLSAIASGISRKDALEMVVIHRGLCENIDESKVPRGEPQVSMAFDLKTGAARRTYKQDRAYDIRPDEVPGTADLVIWDSVRPVVIDWKTTSYQVNLESATEQLRFYALCVSRITRSDDVLCRVGIITSEGAIGWHDIECTFESHLETAAWVRNISREIMSAGADVTTGTHCQYCPAHLHCPATRAALSVLDCDDLGQAWAAAKRIEGVIQTLKERVALAVDSEGKLATGDGRVVMRKGGAIRICKE